MARRLVEAGASFVTVVMENPGGEMPKNCTYNWDSHAVNCHLYEDAKWRFAYYDQAVTALIEEPPDDTGGVTAVTAYFAWIACSDAGNAELARDTEPVLAISAWSLSAMAGAY